MDDFWHKPQIQSPNSVFAEVFRGTQNDEFKNASLAEMSRICDWVIKNTTDTANADGTASYEYAFNLLYGLLSILSIIGLIIVALSIFYNKELR